MILLLLLQVITQKELWNKDKLFFFVLLERTHEGHLILVGLEPTVTELAARVDKLERNLLECALLRVSQQRLSESEEALLVTDASSLNHNVVLLHLAVVRESTHRVYRFVGQIILCGGVVLDKLAVLHAEASPNAVDLLVDLCAVMIALLTSSRHSGLDPARMPGAHTGHLPQALVGLAG